jgi:hypothetical protein
MQLRRRPVSQPSQTDAYTSTITIRLATDADSLALLTLAEVDSASPLQGATLLAEQDGRLRAAYSLRDGATIADPFARTAHLRQLLHTHARARQAAKRRPQATRTTLTSPA